MTRSARKITRAKSSKRALQNRTQDRHHLSIRFSPSGAILAQTKCYLRNNRRLFFLLFIHNGLLASPLLGATRSTRLARKHWQYQGVLDKQLRSPLFVTIK